MISPKLTDGMDVRRASGYRMRMLSCFSTPMLLAASLQSASATSLIQEAGFVPGYISSSQTSDMPTADFDGDGLPDVVVLGSTDYSDVIQVAGVETGTGWKIKQVITPEPRTYYYEAPNLTTWNASDGPHLLYLQRNISSEYAGWPLTLVRRLQLDGLSSYSDAKVADIDNDGTFELVVVSNYSNHTLGAVSLVTGALLWQVESNSNSYANLHIAQLDADPALEIVVTGMPGTVIDGATHAVEWQYKDGFGALIEHGRFGGSSPRFASLSDRIVMFQSQPWSPLWDAGDSYVQASAVVDVDGDNIDELICSSNSFPGGIDVFDVQTQTTRSTFDGDDARQIAAANFDGDPEKEISIGLLPGYFGNDSPSFRVIDANTGVSEFEIPTSAPGPYLPGGFIQSGLTLDLIFGSASGTGYEGTIARVESSTGVVRWQTAENDPAFDLTRINHILMTDLAGNANPTILASGNGQSTYDSRIVALDAEDGSVIWHIGSDNTALPQYVQINGLAAIDANSDSVIESILACTSEPRLRLFDAATRAQIWSSVVMSGECRGAMQLTSNGNKQLVAILSGALRAYDAQTHLLSWSLPFPEGVTGASYLAHGASGAELAVFSDYGISFYDVETRNLLRELVLGDLYPIQAVAQPADASIHDLVVTVKGRLVIVDGVNGEIKASSGPLGLNAGLNNQLALHNNSDGSVLIGVGSDVAVSTHRLDGLSDGIFADGFEPGPP